MVMIEKLPSAFSHLEKFVVPWCCESSQERWTRRCQASMEDINHFYESMLASADDILDYLDGFSLDELVGAEKNLFLLMLSLANVAMAVELHGQPRAPFSPWPHGIRVLKGPQPFGGEISA